MQSRHTLLLATLSLILLMSCARLVRAQGYEPIIENFRLGAQDQLIIDRGGPVDRAGDVNGDSLEDLLVGAGVGAVRVIFGPTLGNNGVLNGQQLDGSSGFVILNDAEFDSVLAGIGDVNDDGLDDIATGSLTGTRIIFGSDQPFERTLDISDLDGENGFVFGSAATDIKRSGDINGDGIADFIVGNANASPNSLQGAGLSHVIFGSASGYPASLSPQALNGSNGFSIIGVSPEDRSGLYVSGAGDFNHDGLDDLLIGAPYQTTDGKAEAGAAYLIYGDDDFPAAITLADIDGSNGLQFKGSDIQNMTGAAVAAIGDINHDGIDDIAIGAPSKGPFGVPSDFPGEVNVLFGGRFEQQQTVYRSDLDGSNGMVLRGIRGGIIPIEANQAIWGDMAGADLDAAGDLNGDGIDDLLIGAPHTIITPQRKGVGQVYVLFGSTSAFPSRMSLADLDGENGFRINGTGTVDYYAVSVSAAGDFNVDGRDDIMMGASGQGETYVFYGRDTDASDFGAAPSAPAGTPSSGFAAAALIPGVDAEPLAFNELPDPTGPDPLPEGTPTDPTNPLTPGYQAPHPFNDADALRPEDMGTDTGSGADSSGETTGTGDSGDGDGGDAGDGGNGSAGGSDAADPDGGDAGTDSGNGAVITGGGATLWFPLLMLIACRRSLAGRPKQALRSTVSGRG